MFREACYYTRMAIGICQFARTPPVSDPEALIQEQLENRESIFLDTVRRVIFDNPGNPYYQMFNLAGCDYEDLRQIVEYRGLEAALTDLHKEGICLTHDEFKRKEPIIRSGKHIPSNKGSFVNPLVRNMLVTRTSGSRSPGTWTPRNKPLLLYREARSILRGREFGLESCAHIELQPILPSAGGLFNCLQAGRCNKGVERWFTAGGSLRDNLHYRTVTRGLVFLGNLMGARSPYPTYLSHNDFTPVAKWIAQLRLNGVPSVVNSFASPAVRVADAALTQNLDIRGTQFLLTGEALTNAKRRVIEATGAKAYPGYAITEIGGVGQACRRMTTGNCVHIYRDSTAVINYRRRAPLSDAEVNSLLFTTLLPFSPLLLINAEMGDSGTIEDMNCDCAFARAGSVQQIRNISSFSKLTGQGVTLVGTDIMRLLEEVLPSRFGGRPGDFQLVEDEARAQTRITLRVSPRVKVSSPEEIRSCFLEELRGFYGGSLAVRIWSHSEGVKVVVAEPIATSTGKVNLLHLMGASRG